MSFSSPSAQRQPTTGKKKKLEPLSPAASRIVQAALREDIAVTELAGMAASDPAFALRILGYVNNPVLGIGRKIESVSQAAALLGIRGLRSLALSLVITHLAPEAEGTEMLLANCLRRAVATREVARRLRFPEPDACFTVGLFLDAGLLVSAREDPKSAILIANSPASFRLIRERAVGLRMHPDLGALIAREHFLSDDIVEAILRHHGIAAPANPLARIAWVAERVASVFEGGYYEPARSQALDALQGMGLTEQHLDEMLTLIPQAVVELSTVFDRYVGPQLEIEALRARAEESIVALTEQYESLVASLENVVRTKEELENQLRDSNGKIEELCTTDRLTGICNRQAVRQALDRDLAAADRDGTPVSVLLIDIDHFRSVNDTWGHATGDAVLCMVAQLLLGCLRNGDVVGRTGGGEFMILLPCTESTGAAIVGERIRAALPQNGIAGPKGPVSVTCSIGIATATGPGCRTAQDGLLHRADQALHAAKVQGRDRVVIAA